MSGKTKGTNAERELVHLFWRAGWCAVRVAGSGSNRYPSADILASNGLRTLAIECKATKSQSKYFTEEEISNFGVFAEKFGAEPFIAMRFNREPWLFLKLDNLEKSGKCYVVSYGPAKEIGMLLGDVLVMKAKDL